MSELIKATSLNINQQSYATDSIKKPEEIKIFVAPDVKAEVEKLRVEFGNDKMLEVLAGMSGSATEINAQDLAAFRKIDGKSNDVSKDDINIFKNAANMYLANQDKIKDFKPVLNFTKEYLDIENGDLGDNLYLSPSKDIENAFKTAKLSENESDIQIELNDFNFSNPNDKSISVFNKENSQMTFRLKSYETGQERLLLDTRFTNQLDLIAYQKGIKPSGIGGAVIELNGAKYRYNPLNDSFSLYRVNSAEAYIYSASEEKMIPYSQCYTDVAKKLYGDNFFETDMDKTYSMKNTTGVKGGRKLTDADIQKILSDPTSTIGKIYRFNVENKDNPDINTVLDMELMNNKLIETLKAGKLKLLNDSYSYGSTEVQRKDSMIQEISVNYPKNYSSNPDDPELFNTLYHELINAQQGKSMPTYKREHQAFTGANRAEIMLSSSITDKDKQDIEELTKYILNYLYNLKKD